MQGGDSGDLVPDRWRAPQDLSPARADVAKRPWVFVIYRWDTNLASAHKGEDLGQDLGWEILGFVSQGIPRYPGFERGQGV